MADPIGSKSRGFPARAGAFPVVGGTAPYPQGNLPASAIPSDTEVDWSNVQDTPTTVAGYGITDAVDTTSNQTVGGSKTFTDPIVADEIDSTDGSGLTVNVTGGGSVDFEVDSDFTIDAGNGGVGGFFLSGVGGSEFADSLTLDIVSPHIIIGDGAGQEITITGGTVAVGATLVDLATTVTQVKVPTVTYPDNSENAASTAYVTDAIAAAGSGPSPSTTVPLVDSGTGVVGTGTTYARDDHQHPIDTSRLATAGGAMSGALGLSGLKPGYTPVANVAYTALVTDLIIAYTSITASRAVTLPAASTGQMLILADRSGSVSATIVIQATPNGTDTINGSNTTQTAVNMAHGAVLLIPDKVSGWIMTQIAVEGGSPTFANLTAGTVVVTGASGFVTQNVNQSGLYNTYNNKTVAGSGIIPMYAVSNLTAQAAAQSATSLVTAAQAIAVGLWRISYRAVITTAATASSALGGSTGFQVNYTDSDTNTALVSASGPVSSANTVGTVVSGDVYVYGKASTAITFSFGYASSGATAMAYSLRVRAEWLG